MLAQGSNRHFQPQVEALVPTRTPTACCASTSPRAPTGVKKRPARVWRREGRVLVLPSHAHAYAMSCQTGRRRRLRIAHSRRIAGERRGQLPGLAFGRRNIPTGGFQDRRLRPLGHPPGHRLSHASGAPSPCTPALRPHAPAESSRLVANSKRWRRAAGVPLRRRRSPRAGTASFAPDSARSLGNDCHGQ